MPSRQIDICLRCSKRQASEVMQNTFHTMKCPVPFCDLKGVPLLGHAAGQPTGRCNRTRSSLGQAEKSSPRGGLRVDGLCPRPAELSTTPGRLLHLRGSRPSARTSPASSTRSPHASHLVGDDSANRLSPIRAISSCCTSPSTHASLAVNKSVPDSPLACNSRNSQSACLLLRR